VATVKNDWAEGDEFTNADENAHATETNANSNGLAAIPPIPPMPASAVVGIDDVQTLTNKTLMSPTLKGFTEVTGRYTVTTSFTPDLSKYTIFALELTAGTGCVVTMPTAVDGKSFLLLVMQAATGGGSIGFSSVKWPGGTVPVMSTAANARDIFRLTCIGTRLDTKWYGTVEGKAFA
jgi:hypothetical protein